MNQTYYLNPNTTYKNLPALTEPHKLALPAHPPTPAARELRELVDHIAPPVPPPPPSPLAQAIAATAAAAKVLPPPQPLPTAEHLVVRLRILVSRSLAIRDVAER